MIEKAALANDGVDAEFTLWMERGFTRQEIARRMLAAAPSLRIISTPIQPVEGTEVIAIPDLKTAQGIEAANEIIADNHIDAFWPQNSARLDLADLNTTVHAAATPEVTAMVDDKSAFTDWLEGDPYQADSTEVLGVQAVAKEYERRRALGKEVCVKPVIGVNGNGYWQLTEALGASFLKDPEDRSIHPDVYFAALAQEELSTGPQRMLVMDWLPGPEISVDILSWRGDPLIHAARTKVDGSKSQRIQSEHPVVEHARFLVAKLAMHGMVSVQYRLDMNGEDWKTLEINPRPAGGVIKSEDAGFGIITGWTRLMMGDSDPADIVQPSADMLVTTVRNHVVSEFVEK